MRELIICVCLLGCFSIVNANNVEPPKEVKIVHNDDSVILHKKIYQLEKRIERLEELLKKEGK
nr:MAG TPA: zipper dimerization domain transcription factor-like protein [Caudoviricetes sp.]